MTNPDDQAIINMALAEQRRKQNRRAAVTVVQPTSGVLPVMNLKSLDNWRAFVHQLVAVVVPVLVTLNIVTENAASAWVPFLFAIADNVLSVGNTVDRVRRAIYATVGVAQAGGLATVLLSSAAPQWIPVTSAGLTILSAFLARFYTPTTTLVPAAVGKHTEA